MRDRYLQQLHRAHSAARGSARGSRAGQGKHRSTRVLRCRWIADQHLPADRSIARTSRSIDGCAATSEKANPGILIAALFVAGQSTQRTRAPGLARRRE